MRGRFGEVVVCGNRKFVLIWIDVVFEFLLFFVVLVFFLCWRLCRLFILRFFRVIMGKNRGFCFRSFCCFL